MIENLPDGITAFLNSAGWGAAQIEPLAGDASFRRYFRIRDAEKTAMLMHAPPPHAVDTHSVRVRTCSVDVHVPLATSQMRTVLSSLPLASCWPSGLKHTLKATYECPCHNATRII